MRFTGKSHSLFYKKLFSLGAIRKHFTSSLSDLGPEKVYSESEALFATLDAVYYQMIQYDLPDERTWVNDLFLNVPQRVCF